MAGLAGLNPDFEQKLTDFLNSLPPNVRSRISLNSGYRDNATQARLYQNAVAKYGSEQAARRWVAPPGHSQHNLGKAMDLGIPNDLMAMVHAEAPKHGLVFPLANENWHIEAAGGRGGGDATGLTNEQAALPIQQAVDAGGDPEALSAAGIPTDSAYDRVHSHALTHQLTQEPDPQPQGVKLPGASSTNTAAPFGDIISSASSTYGVDPQILTNLLKTESHFDPNAVSPAGARGIAQFMPATAQSMGIDPLNPQQSITGAAKYLKQLSDRYGGNVKLGLAAYNWGMGNVDKLNGDLSKAPASVQAYVNSIAGGVAGADDTQNSVGSIAKQVGAGVTDIPAQAAASLLPAVGGIEQAAHTLLPAPTGPKAFDLPGMAPAQSPGMESLISPSPITGAIGGASTPPVFAKVAGAPQGTKLLPPTKDTSVTAGLENIVKTGTGISNRLFNTRDPQTFIERLAREAPAAGGLGWLLGGPLGAGVGLGGVLASEALTTDKSPAEKAAIIAQNRAAYTADQPSPDASPGGGVGPAATGDVRTTPDIFNLKNGPDTSAALPALAVAAKTLPQIAMAGPAMLASAAGGIPDVLNYIKANPVFAPKAYEKYGATGLWLLGSTAAFALAPYARLLVGAQKIPQVNELKPHVAPGRFNRVTGQVEQPVSILSPMDVIATHTVDYTKGILNPIRRYMKASGLNYDFLHRLEMSWQHSAAFMANVNSFFENGEMNTAIGRMSVARDATMGILRKAAQMDKDIIPYLDLLRRKDDFLVGKKLVINGQTRNDVITKITNMEAANPNLPKAADIMKANRAAHLQFRVDTGDISSATANKSLISRPNSSDPTLISDTRLARNITNPNPATELDPISEQIMSIMDGSREAFKNKVNTDTVAGALKTNQPLFVEIPVKKADEWEKNKGGPSIVRIRDNGVTRAYSTNPTWAIIMKHGPDKAYPHIMGWLKTWQERIGTGDLAPGYAQTAQQRGLTQGLVTGGSHVTSPAGLIATKLAVPRVLIPQIAQKAAQNIEASLLTDKSLSWLPDAHRQALALRLHDFVENSANYILNTHGGVSQGSSVSDVAKMNYREATGANVKVPGFLRSAYHGYLDYLFATHGSPNTASAMKDLGIRLKRGEPLHDAAMEAAYAGANITGNPRMTGATRMDGSPIPGRPIRSDNPRALLSKDGEAGRLERGITSLLGGGSEIMRGSVPWYNVQVQSMRNVWEAYINNPVNFATRLYAYVITPAVGSYLWNSMLGPQYTDYMMNGRSPQKTLTSNYVGLPGRRPEDGHEWGLPQELAIFSGATKILLHHAFTGNQYGTTQDDLQRMMLQYFKGVLLPSPPGAQTVLGPIVSYLTDYAGGAVRAGKLTEPGDVTPMMDGVLSGLVANLGPTLVHAYEAFHDDPNGYISKTWSAVKEAAYQEARTIQPIREALSLPTTPVRNTQLKLQLDKKEKGIDYLTQYWHDKGQAFLQGLDPSVSMGGSTKGGNFRFNQGEGVDLNPTETYGKNPTTPYIFPSMEPNNKDWLDLANRIQANFRSDNGYKLSKVRDNYDFATWLKRRNAFSKLVTDMRGKPNYGNLADWNKLIVDNPYFNDVVKNMNAGDRRKPDVVYQFAVHQLGEYNKQLLTAILEAERSMSIDQGHPINLETLSPWN